MDLQEGWTPLHVAVQSGRTDIVNLLIARGADTTIQNRVVHHNTYSHFMHMLPWMVLCILFVF